MNRNEYEHLVEKYLSGAMSPADEQEFFIRVAVDSNLRQTLKAYGIVESALRKHRESMASQHLDSRAHLVSLLGINTGTSAQPAPPRAGGFRWSLAAVAAAALTIGAFVVAPLLEQKPASPGTGDTFAAASRRIDRPALQPAPQPEPPAVSQPAPAETTPVADESAHVLPAMPEHRRKVAEVRPRISARHGSSQPADDSPRVDAGRTRPAGDTLKQTAPATLAPQTSDQSGTPQEVPVLRRPRIYKPRYTARDTIKIPVKIDMQPK
jgi:hypothetical protein